MLFSHTLIIRYLDCSYLVASIHIIYHLKAVGQGQVYRNFVSPGNFKFPPTYMQVACLMPTTFFFSYKYLSSEK